MNNWKNTAPTPEGVREGKIILSGLDVGYRGRAIIKGIETTFHAGEIVTLIGPNGAGKSTILKTITRQLSQVGGVVSYQGRDVRKMTGKELASKMAVVLTERLKPELMTCRDIVAAGRYPFTGILGVLRDEDEIKIDEAMKAVHIEEIAERDFNSISDGQRQRVLLARAICQEPEVIVLDEPTSFLDIHHKLELLAILQKMAREEGIAIIMSLHEIDLAMKVSDRIICVKGESIFRQGRPDEIFDDATIKELYEIENGFFDTLTGSIELPKIGGKPEVFVLSSCGNGIPVYRSLEVRRIPFAAGILYTNDVDYRVARLLASKVLTAEAFSEITEEQVDEAVEVMKQCREVINAGLLIGASNARMKRLLTYAENSGKCASTS